jgi:hypothetical protein
MTAVALSRETSRRLSGRQLVVLAMVTVGISALLYFEYRTFSRVAATPATEADSMCLASRIGLPCR